MKELFNIFPATLVHLCIRFFLNFYCFSDAKVWGIYILYLQTSHSAQFILINRRESQCHKWQMADGNTNQLTHIHAKCTKNSRESMTDSQNFRPFHLRFNFIILHLEQSIEYFEICAIFTHISRLCEKLSDFLAFLLKKISTVFQFGNRSNFRKFLSGAREILFDSLRQGQGARYVFSNISVKLVDKSQEQSECNRFSDGHQFSRKISTYHASRD